MGEFEVTAGLHAVTGGLKVRHHNLEQINKLERSFRLR
jgi:hypothetical protein